MLIFWDINATILQQMKTKGFCFVVLVVDFQSPAHAKCRFNFRSVGVQYEGLILSTPALLSLPKLGNKVRKPVEFHQVLQDYWFTFTSTLTWTRTVAPSFSLSLSEGRLRFLSRCCRPLLLHHLIIFSSKVCVCACVRTCICARTHTQTLGWLAGWLTDCRAGLGNTWSRSMRRGFMLVAHRPLV